ncbi:pimeloyl-ACP methyl ester carboxylesterase [Catenuloplanes nepalensis]|uniref:Pimeloyl-ACP methyl ester carboxylesterase n=1 Tax=Catenuloplanes nepalensis TaxID=587533 RepID=A0ABT9MNI6_9ACTN|nr:alpha/beta hydrolase [Catenuloplanes nepalensis]MDP9793012.1 pimeloyl-ACP methyl ester carboxylesterase [Catenuloplanes nepalensis]
MSVPLPHDETGTGSPTLLLVHGWGGDRRSWASTAPLFAARHRVLAVDVRGHGDAPRPPAGYDPRTIAGDLAALLRGTDAGPVVAIGHSWGGQLVTALAAHHPGAVRAVVTVDPAYGATDEAALRDQLRDWRSPGARAALRDFAEGAFSDATPETVREQVRAGLRDTDARVLADAFEAMYLAPDAFGIRDRTEAFLRRGPVPMLSLFSTEAAAAWARSLPATNGSAVEAWPGAGHYLHQERPAEFVAVVERWLTTLP